MGKKREADIPLGGDVVELGTIGQGKFADVFRRDLGRVVANILDPTTPSGVARQITVKLTIKPVDDRSAARCEIESSVKLAPEKSVVTAFLVGTEQGQLFARESDDPQTVEEEEEDAPA